MDAISKLKEEAVNLNHLDINKEVKAKTYLIGVRRDGGFGEPYHYEKIEFVRNEYSSSGALSYYKHKHNIHSSIVTCLCEVPSSLVDDHRLMTLTGLYDIINEFATKDTNIK